jgi:hypothetical protein
MSIVTVPAFCFPELPSTPAAAPSILGAATLDINGTSEYVAFVFSCPKTVTVDSVFFRVNAASQGCTATVRIETVDAATGVPSGNLPDANATTTVNITNGAANYEVTFPGTFTLTNGTLYAIYIGAPTSVTTPIGINFATFADDGGNIGMPYAIDYDTSADYKDSLAPCFGLGLSGGSALFIKKLWPISAAATETFSSTSTPDIIGNKITIKAPMRVCGAWAWVDLDEAATIRLYNTDGSGILGSAQAYKNVPANIAQYINIFQFSGSVELPAGDYYLAAEATTITGIGIGAITFSNARWRSASPMGGADFCYTSCTSPPTGVGSWTNTTTKQAFIGLIIDGIEAGGGGETSHVFIG